MDMSDRKNQKLYPIKGYKGKYKRKLNRINKRRNKQIIKEYINEIINDLADYEFSNLYFDCFLYDIYGQCITSKQDLVISEWATDANYQDYYMFDRDNWLEYLGKTWTLEDELEYCDRVFENFDEDID